MRLAGFRGQRRGEGKKKHHHVYLNNVFLFYPPTFLEGSLGAGNFGEVRMGRLKDNADVAVKTSKADKMTSEAFLKEADKMKKVSHKHCFLF